MATPESSDRPPSAIAGAVFERVRLARGVVGKASTVATAAVVALGTIAFYIKEPMYLLTLAAMIVFVFAIYFGGTLWFANRHPGISLLEGADLIQWRQMEMASRDHPKIGNPPISVLTSSVERSEGYE